ncbi:ATPase [Aureococcus anophagefferens]|nr:ATPase [Aureococcus anophagefferens]
MVDAVGSDAPHAARQKRFTAACVELGGIVAASLVFTAARSYAFNASGQKVVARLRGKLFGAMLAQDVAWFDDRRVGDLLNRLSSDTTKLQAAATETVSLALRSALSAVVSLGLLFLTSWRLTLVALSVVPFMTMVTMVCVSVIKRLAARTRPRRDAGAVAQDAAVQALFITMTAAFGYASVLGVWYYGGLLVIRGDMTTGELVAFDDAASCEFRDVVFAYAARPGVEVLRGASLVVPARTRAAFVGASRGGKTTLLHLLARFYDVSGGSVRFDGVDVADFEPAELRVKLALVAQVPALFSGSIATTPLTRRCPGAPRPDMDAVIAAAKAANAHVFTQAFPDGYDSLVGERGECSEYADLVRKQLSAKAAS